MKEGYIIREQDKAHFITATVVNGMKFLKPNSFLNYEKY
tara:strand:+ start:311 stop:427 length:117 start_codon:yes stop_codon:yes gene_type:complete